MAENQQSENTVSRLNRLEFMLWFLLNERELTGTSTRELFTEFIRQNQDGPLSAEFLRYISQRSDEDRSENFQRGISKPRGSVEHTVGMFKSVDAHLLLLDQQNAELRHKLRTLEGDVSPWLAMMSLGVETSQIPLTRYLPVRIYAAGADYFDLLQAKKSLPLLLEVIGCTLAHELPDQSGSIFSKAWAKTNQAATEPEIAKRLEKMERALQLQGLDKPQAEVDALYFNAAAAFLKSVEDIPTVVTQVGPLLVLKLPNSEGGMVQVKKLSTDQLIALEKNQSWLSSPADIFAKLDGACNATKEPIYKSVFDDAALSAATASNKKLKSHETDEDEPPLGLPPPA